MLNRLKFAYFFTLILLALFAAALLQTAANSAIVVGGVLLAGGTIVIVLPTLHSMKRQITALSDATRELTSGNLAHRIVVDDRHDELAQAARGINAVADRLEDCNATLDAFAYTVSHDLRAPLRAMHGFSSALLEDYGAPLGNQGRDYATRVVMAAAQMDGLLQDLLAYSRLSRADLTFERVDTDALVDAVLRRMDLQIAERVEVLRPLPIVRAQRAILQQCLEHLISNALKFARPESASHVRIGADALANGTARLWVEDDGIGIAPEHHERIFRVFERLHGNEVYPGNGIGLALVKKGAERMHARVGVESTPGRGSRFWLELPQGTPAA
jgi:signal transduction histidine kinase